jgi:hypothetical protein
MKKVLATVAALGLVVGFAASAMALDQPSRASQVESTTAPRVPQPTAPGVALWSVAGQWVLAGAYLSDGLGLPGGADVNNDYDPNTGADAFYIYSFKILPTLQINDKISMEGEFRFADRDVFGWTDTSLTPVIENDKVLKNSGRLIDTYTLWMNWMSPIGKMQFGRMPAGAWGTKFIDNSTQGDRLRWYPKWMPENWGMLLFTQKVTEQDAAYGALGGSDADKDAYYIDLSYKAPFGKTTGAFWIVKDATAMTQGPATGTPNAESYYTSNFWLTGNYNFDALNLEYELNLAFGDATATKDASGWGFYTDVNYKIQDFKIGGIFFILSGDDDLSDNDNKALLSTSTGTGKDFNPYQILTGDYMRMLNGDMGGLTADRINPMIANSSYNAGVWSLGGYVDYAMSPELTIRGILGYAAATDEPSGFDADYGFEAGIGMGYKLMDNLTYNAHFSYLWTGDFFLGDKTDPYNDSCTQDVWLVAHALSMSF